MVRNELELFHGRNMNNVFELMIFESLFIYNQNLKTDTSQMMAHDNDFR